MADPTYSYTSDADRLAEFIAEHIATHHTVQVADPQTLSCRTCGRIVKVYGQHASEVFYKNRPGR